MSELNTQESPEVTKGILPQEWIDSGYVKFSQPQGYNSADYGLQKLFKDELGKQYYLTVFVYENYKKSYYEQHKEHMNTWSYQPDLQFTPEGKLTMNIEFLMDNGSTIQDVEDQVQELWVSLNKPYYELWN